MLENYKVRILIVEDSKSLGMVYAAVARQLDAAVRVAETGVRAMEIINEFQPEIILLDLWLPDVKGMDILRYIQKQELKIVTIVMTANGSVDYAVESMRLGAYDFLEKPISTDRLRTTLNNTIEKIKLSALAEPFIPGNSIPGGFIGESPAIKAVFDREGSASYASWAVRFAASQENILSVLSGMSSLAQMEDNLSYMKDFVPLSAHEMEVIKEAQQALDEDKSIQCTSCHYCTKGCPMGIPIPEIFNVENRKKGSPEFRTLREYSIVTQGKGKAGECIECGQCEGACPQHLPIIRLLAECALNFEK